MIVITRKRKKIENELLMLTKTRNIHFFIQCSNICKSIID